MRIDNVDDGLKHFGVPTSFNNRLIVEVYKKKALESKERNGFAFVAQKLALTGLRVLVNAQLNDGTLVTKGSIAFIKEETLHTQQWAQKAYESDFFKEPFLIVDLQYVEFIQPTVHKTQELVNELESKGHEVEGHVCDNPDCVGYFKK